jgi:PAS domain S-box-containing protein
MRATERAIGERDADLAAEVARLRAELARRSDEAPWHSIFELMHEGFALCEMLYGADGAATDFRYLQVNAAFERLTGVPATAVVGRPASQAIPGIERFWTEAFARVVATGEPAHLEHQVAALERWFEVLAHRTEHDRFAVLFLNITDRKRSEAALREINETLEQRVAERTQELAATQALLRTIYDHSGECHVLLAARPEGGFVYQEANPAVLRLYRKSREQVVGHTLEDVLGPVAAAEVNRHLNECLRTAGPYRYERAQEGSIVEAVCAPVPFEQGNPARIVVTARDVTESRRLEEQLRQSQKMEAVGQLTGGVAHDFNNLLTGITGSLELLRTRIAQGRLADLDRYVSAAQGAARRAATLTHRLLAFSRRQTLDPKPTDVNRLIAGMADLIHRTVGPEVELEVVGAAGAWTTLVDPNQLENALLNLCINARDAMPHGGRITIETANKWLDGRAGQDRDLLPGQYLALCVTDTGTGMTPEVARRAFDPFFTTKPLGMGTGLGLSMVYGFARQSGGQARIYSEPGRGTTMCLYLPRHHGADAVADGAAATAVAAGAAQGETVLVVDDEPTVRMLVAEVLNELGYIAVEAEDGAAGLKLLQSEHRIDLLVTDVGLPGGINGRQLADAARTTRPGLKVLFITGYAENAVVGNGHLAHGMHVLTKPFGMEDLAERIRELVAKA